MVYTPQSTTRATLSENKIKANLAASINVPPGTYACHQLNEKGILTAEDHGYEVMAMSVVQNQPVKNFPQTWGQISQSNFEAEINGAPVAVLTDWFLHFFITNTAATGAVNSDIVLPIAQAFVERIEVLTNGSATDDTIYTTELVLSYLDRLKSETERSFRAPPILMENKAVVSLSSARTTWTMYDEAGVTIGPGESVEVLLPITCFLTQTKLPLVAKIVQSKVKVYGNVNPVCSDSGALALAAPLFVVSGMESVFTGTEFEPSIRARLQAHYLARETRHGILVHDRIKVGAPNIALGVYLSDILFQPFNGDYVKFDVWVDRSDATAEQLWYGSNRTAAAASDINPLKISKVTFNDSASRPICYNDMPEIVITHGLSSKVLSGRLAFNTFKNYLSICFFGNNNTLFTGSSSGGIGTDSSYVMRVALSDTNVLGATTSGTVNVLGHRKATLIMNAGSFLVEKS